MPAFLIMAAAVAAATAFPVVTPLTYSPPAKSVDAAAVANGSPAMKQDVMGKADDMICKRTVATAPASPPRIAAAVGNGTSFPRTRIKPRWT